MTAGRKATWGDDVCIEYTGRRKDGVVVDGSPAGEPLSFVIGVSPVFDAFNRAAWGLRVGERRTVRVEAAEAFGERDATLVTRVALRATQRLPVVGELIARGGRSARVTAIAGRVVTLDANHPLAGEALTYDIRLVAIGLPA